MWTRHGRGSNLLNPTPTTIKNCFRSFGEAYSHHYYNGRSNAMTVIKFKDNRKTELSLHHSVIVI